MDGAGGRGMERGRGDGAGGRGDGAGPAGWSGAGPAAHREGRSAEPAESAPFIPAVPPVRGGPLMTEPCAPSPHSPGSRRRHGSDGAAAEWGMLIHRGFQRSAGLKLHGRLAF